MHLQSIIFREQKVVVVAVLGVALQTLAHSGRIASRLQGSVHVRALQNVTSGRHYNKDTCADTYLWCSMKKRVEYHDDILW
jgi:hypothetical protein